MVFNLDELKISRGSFRGVPFLLRDDEMEFGRKKIVHEFINSDRRYIEDVGLVNRIFSINCFVGTGLSITGQISSLLSLSGSDAASKRDALLAALEKEGPGLLIHPFYGSKIVHVMKGTVRQSITDVGIVYFSFSAYESQDNLYPGVGSANPSLLNQLGLKGLDNVISNFSANYRTALLRGATMLDAIQKAYSIGSFFSGVYDRFRSGSASSLLREISAFNANAPTYAANPDEYGAATVGLFNEADDFGMDATEKFNIAKSSFNFGSDDINLINFNTAYYDDLNENRKQVNIMMRTAGLIQAYRNAAKIDYQYDIQVENISTILNSQFDYIEKNYNINFDLKNSLYDLRDEITKYFDTLSVDISKIITVNIKVHTPLRVICHRYYGSQDNFEILRQLNPFQHTGFIIGDIKIIEPA